MQWLDAVSQFTKVIELKKHEENHPMPYSIEHDMSAFQGSSIMAYVQTVASYIFKHILLKCTKHSAIKNVQDYSTRCDYD